MKIKRFFESHKDNEILVKECFFYFVDEDYKEDKINLRFDITKTNEDRFEISIIIQDWNNSIVIEDSNDLDFFNKFNLGLQSIKIIMDKLKEAISRIQIHSNEVHLDIKQGFYSGIIISLSIRFETSDENQFFISNDRLGIPVLFINTQAIKSISQNCGLTLIDISVEVEQNKGNYYMKDDESVSIEFHFSNPPTSETDNLVKSLKNDLLKKYPSFFTKSIFDPYGANSMELEISNKIAGVNLDF